MLNAPTVYLEFLGMYKDYLAICIIKNIGNMVSGPFHPVCVGGGDCPVGIKWHMYGDRRNVQRWELRACNDLLFGLEAIFYTCIPTAKRKYITDPTCTSTAKSTDPPKSVPKVSFPISYFRYSLPMYYVLHICTGISTYSQLEIN
jgi:hypothetical protein